MQKNTAEKEETMLQYVLRKIADPAYNCAEISRRTGVSRATLSELGSGKNSDPQHSTVELIYACFKQLDQ